LRISLPFWSRCHISKLFMMENDTASHQIMPWLDGMTACKFIYWEHSKTMKLVRSPDIAELWQFGICLSKQVLFFQLLLFLHRKI
jgi:hypothetical protein